MKLARSGAFSFSSSMKKWIRLLGLLLLGLILWRIDLADLGRTLAACRWPLLLGAFATGLLVVLIKSLRWKLLLRAQGYSYPPQRAVAIYFVGLYLGLITPGKLGELARVAYVKRDLGIGLGEALPSIILDRAYDLYALLLLGLLACFRYDIAGDFSSLFLVCLVILASAPLILLNPRLGRRLVAQFFGRAAERRFGRMPLKVMDDFLNGLELLRITPFLVGTLMTVGAYLMLFASAFLLAQSLAIDIRFLDLALALGMANLLALIPVTLAGVGTRDAVFLLCFSFLGLQSAQALALSTLVLANFYLGTAAVGFIYFLLDRPHLKLEEG